VQDDPRSGQPKTQRTDANVDRVRTDHESTVLFGSADMITIELWPDKWSLHHDNAPVHDVLTVREFLAKKSITKMDHPPYSPDCDPWLFATLKKFPKGTKIC
jgi:hypothetical protein